MESRVRRRPWESMEGRRAATVPLHDAVVRSLEQYQRVHSSLGRQTRSLHKSGVITQTLQKCSATIGVRNFLASKNLSNQGSAERRAASTLPDLANELALLAPRNRFLEGCSELFLVLAKCYGVPQTPIDVSEWTGFAVDAVTAARILLEADAGEEARLHVQQLLEGGVLDRDLYGPADFMALAMEVCPFEEQAPDFLPRTAHTADRGTASPPRNERGGRDDKATACREGARPEIVIEVAKRRGREERRREELARYVSNIFEKLSAKKLQKHLVSATMRPDREDPFVRAGKLRMQQVYRRRKRKLSEALVRNLSSCIDLMTHQANVEFNRRHREEEQEQRAQEAKMLRKARDLTLLRVRERAASSSKLRRQGAQQDKKELGWRLEALRRAEAARLERIRESKPEFQLSEYTSSTIEPDEAVVGGMKRATKLSEFKQLRRLERSRVAAVRHDRMEKYKSAKRGAYELALRHQARLPYLKGQQSLDGSHVFQLVQPDEAAAPAARVEGRWRWKQRDVPTLPPEPGGRAGSAGKGADTKEVQVPPVMKAAERVFGRPRSSERGSRSRSRAGGAQSRGQASR